MYILRMLKEIEKTRQNNWKFQIPLNLYSYHIFLLFQLHLKNRFEKYKKYNRY